MSGDGGQSNKPSGGCPAEVAATRSAKRRLSRCSIGTRGRLPFASAVWTGFNPPRQSIPLAVILGAGRRRTTRLIGGGTEIAICRNCIDLLQPQQQINPICGNPGCGEDADYALDWNGRRIAICQGCEHRLRPAPPIDRSCVGEEIRHHWSMEFRSAQTEPRLSEKLRECWEWLMGR